jgi:hypothetical protein
MCFFSFPNGFIDFVCVADFMVDLCIKDDNYKGNIYLSTTKAQQKAG